MFYNNNNQESFAPEDLQLKALQKQPTSLLLKLFGIVIVMYSLISLGTLLFSPQSLKNDKQPIIIAIIFSSNFMLYLSSYVTQRYWERKQQQRLLAHSQPERYLAEKQPVPSSIIPQFVKVSLYIQKSKVFAFVFVYIFIIVGSLSYSLHLSIFISLLIGLTTALVTSGGLFWYSLSKKHIQPYVELSEAGISTSLNNTKILVRWQDALLFSTYHGPRVLFLFGKSIQYYELASAHTLVRWQWQHALATNYVTRPTMEQETYDQWQEQLQGYIVTRTGLPLHDLDAVEVPPQKALEKA